MNADSCSGQHAQYDFEPGTIIQAADAAIAWTQSVIEDVNKFVFPGAKPIEYKRAANPTGWVQGTFLVGMKDWATTSGNETHWQYLKVIFFPIELHTPFAVYPLQHGVSFKLCTPPMC
jgi:hypothetical protein